MSRQQHVTEATAETETEATAETETEATVEMETEATVETGCIADAAVCRLTCTIAHPNDPNGWNECYQRCCYGVPGRMSRQQHVTEATAETVTEATAETETEATVEMETEATIE